MRVLRRCLGIGNGFIVEAAHAQLREIRLVDSVFLLTGDLGNIAGDGVHLAVCTLGLILCHKADIIRTGTAPNSFKGRIA